jgi:hypothetical protein
MRVRPTCEVELLRTDAAEFDVPDHATVIYFYKPLGRLQQNKYSGA